MRNKCFSKCRKNVNFEKIPQKCEKTARKDLPANADKLSADKGRRKRAAPGENPCRKRVCGKGENQNRENFSGPL